MISVLVFSLFGGIVVYGLLDLRRSKLSPSTKTLILTIVGILLSLSLLISTLKENRHLTFSLLKTNLNILEQKFTQLPPYTPKYNLTIPDPINEALYIPNYPLYNEIQISNREKLIYVSKENQGASVFLHHLAQKLQQKRIPAFYARFTSEVYDENQILEVLDIPSLNTLKDLISTWNLKSTIPYLIIDGLEYTSNCRKFLTELQQIFRKQDANFVGNVENKMVLERIFEVFEWKDFVVREWIPPDQAFVERVFPTGYFKRLTSDFSTLSQIQTSSEDEILMRNSLKGREMANQQGLTDLVREMGAKEVRLSAVKTQMSPQQLDKALSSGLLKLNQGLLSVNPQHRR